MFNDSSHPSRELLRQAIAGELRPRQSAAVELHVVDCDVCRQLMEESLAAGCANPATASRVRALRSRLRDDLVLLSEQLPAASSPAARTRVGLALAMVLLAAIAVAVGARQQTMAVPGTTWLLGPDGYSPLPDASITPGAVHQATATDLCTGHRPRDRSVSSRVRLAVLRDYRMEAVPAQEYELDYLITPELGGASTRQNLWPERYASRIWNARVKDQLEELLPRMVCDGRLNLATAQRDIAADWIAAYKKYFHTEMPLAPQVAMRDDDDIVLETDVLEMELTRPRVALAQLAWR